MEKHFKTVGLNFPTKHITGIAKILTQKGYIVTRDSAAGTMVAKFEREDGTFAVVVRAMQMGRGRNWMMRADPAVLKATN